ncbi:Cell division cycle protein 123 [Babesia duncani]|uniref:Cell division cycle protein 123 n=1 Tax=Babesia duncani TaxID=323732 RepID=A0AAD9PKI5_9APIC|nr:Cell division cycle protein 123 [Babesia duncani]
MLIKSSSEWQDMQRVYRHLILFRQRNIAKAIRLRVFIHHSRVVFITQAFANDIYDYVTGEKESELVSEVLKFYDKLGPIIKASGVCNFIMDLCWGKKMELLQVLPFCSTVSSQCKAVKDYSVFGDAGQDANIVNGIWLHLNKSRNRGAGSKPHSWCPKDVVELSKYNKNPQFDETDQVIDMLRDYMHVTPE